jgi:hypothetical protein
MNWSELESHWDRYSVVAAQAWDRLTHDDLADIDGNRDRMLDTLARRYEVDRGQAERLLDDGLERLQGEGNYEASREYQAAQHEFADRGGDKAR